jgi:S-adenosylmethionine hydrolase
MSPTPRAFALSTLLGSVALTAGCEAAAPASHTDAAAAARPTVAFMSDFGVLDDSVALCKGEMLRVAPSVRLVDVTHQVTPYDVAEAARFLAGAAPHFPAPTVFVCVIDPGVGSERKPLAVRFKSGHGYVGPDNGLITLLEQKDPVAEAREIANEGWMLGGKRSSTFHGRDIFAPVGAHLAAGDRFADVGPVVPTDKLVRLKLTSAAVDDKGLTGEIVGLDGPYGNLVTNVPAELFAKLGYKLGESVPVTIGGKTLTIPLAKTFSDVPAGKDLLYIDSRGRLAAAVNLGNFAKVHAIEPPAKLFIPAKAK